MRSPWLLLILFPLLLTSCGGPGTYAEDEQFQSDPRHRRDFKVAAPVLCDAARRVLLGDGYIVTKGEGQSLFGDKEFQGEEKRRAILHLCITCEQRQADSSTLFVTAIEEHFDVKTSRKSTLIGVPIVAPLSIGTRSEADNQVMTRGETVTDREFYERIYRAVRRELPR